MDTVSMKATVYAGKLRRHREKLKKDRVKELKDYDTAVAIWRKDLATWLRLHAEERIKGITKKELQDNRGRYNRDSSFSTSDFFAGSPQPPKYPSDQRIRDITGALRHLAITGQANIKVSESDTKKLFGDEEDEDD